DHDSALAHAGEHAVLAEHDLAQIVIIADAGHDKVLSLGRLARRGCGLAAVLRDPFFGFGRGAVINRDLVAAFRFEMSGHRVAHDAEPDKCDLCHYLLRAAAWSRSVFADGSCSEIKLSGTAHGPAGAGASTTIERD